MGYEYDFGSTTDLEIKVLSEQQMSSSKAVALLARNDPPQMICGKCGKPAKVICSECVGRRRVIMFQMLP
jgi:hypothetical protein